MGNQKDIAEKNLESFNDVFADIVNVLLFNGEEVIKENDLEQARALSSYASEAGIREQERDEAKFWKKCEFRIALFAFENQTKGDPDMPFRVIGYDGTGYRDQLYYVKTANGTYVRNKNPRYPVITLVLNFGKERWNTNRTLLENIGDIPEQLKPYVSDYKINIFDISFLSDEQVNKFKSDFKIVADYFVKTRKNTEYEGSQDEFRHEYETRSLMSYLTNDDRFLTSGKKGAKNMCEVLDKIENRGIEKGRAEGIAEGIEKGIEKGRAEGILSTLVSLVKDNILSLGDAAKRANMSISEFEEKTGLKA